MSLSSRTQARREPRELPRCRRRFAHEALCRTRRVWTGLQQLGEDRLDSCIEMVRHLVDEADAESRLGVEALAGEEEASRTRADPGKHERGDDRGNDPEPHLGETERRVRRGDREIRARGEAGASAERVALDARDDRGRARVDRLEHLVEAECVLDVLVERELDGASLPVDVRARGEGGAVSGEYHRARIADSAERVVQLGDQRGVERIAPLGLGDRDAPHGPVPLDSQRRHCAGEPNVRRMARVYAAALTPLRDEGNALDEEVVAPYAEFLQRGGCEGVLALGTTGEGVLLTVGERQRVTELFLETPLRVFAHCGAQTTGDTVMLTEHAAAAGAHGVAVIAPPYFRLDDDALLAHFSEAARACAPTPFYVYEFAGASGYAVPPSLIERLRERAPNLAGMKVSDTPWEAFAPYLLEGLEVFVGPEALIAQGLEHGAVGAVSALASALPERVVAVDPGLAETRATIERFPRHAALKHIASRRGVPLREDVRAPLRPLSVDERRELDEWLDASS